MEIKLLKKGIKVDGKYFSAWYSKSENNIKGDATIYLRSYESLPDGDYGDLKVENHSDLMSDYFEKDLIRVPATSKYFDQVERLAR